LQNDATCAIQFSPQEGILRRISIMAQRCEICGKGPMTGSNISHAHNVTKRRWLPNIQRVRAMVDGTPKYVKVCTRCIRSGKVTKAPRI
jgi:large subunit ribosomal protein L28